MATDAIAGAAKSVPTKHLPCLNRRGLVQAFCAGGGGDAVTRDPSRKAPFADMNLHTLDLGEDAKKARRVRQHINPLRQELQVEAQPLNWDEVYDTPERPLVVDIGCGYGRFLLQLARVHANSSARNYLGLEIRHPIIVRANEWAQQLDLKGTVRFERANATISFASMLRTYPGPVELVTIQFPDPHFKKRHRKRHTVQPRLCQEIASVIPPGARVFLQSDVLPVAEYVRDTFEHATGHCFCPDPEYHTPQNVMHAASDATVDDGQDGEDREGGGCSSEPDVTSAPETERALTWARAGWLVDNPLGVPTERELFAIEQGGSAYRMMLLRNDVNAT